MEINLDFEKESMDILKSKQQDDRTLVANIFSDSVPFDLTGSLIKVNASNYLGQGVIQTENISVSGNKVTINLMRDITRVAGMTKLEIAITKTNKQITTFTFYLDVKQSVLEGAKLETSIVADIIEVLTTKINEAVAVKQETEHLIATGGAASKGDVANLTAQMDNNTKKIIGRKSILDYEKLVLNKGQINEDWKNALQQARDDLASATQKYRLVFPTGVYQYSVSPNWAISKAQIVAEGEVRLRYTGTEDAVIIDSGAVTGLTWDMEFGKFIVEAEKTAKNGVFVRGVHASRIDVKVVGCGEEYAGVRIEWCVCTDFYTTVSNNHEGWYKDAKPKYGLFIDKKAQQPVGQGGYTSWCTFYTPKIEGCQIGIHLERSQGCSFYSGTSEGCTQYGIVVSSNALYNKFFSIDMEVNTLSDIQCLGRENEFYDVDSTGIISFEGYARHNVLTGGSLNQINFVDTTYNNLVNNVKYNRFNKNATISDDSEKNRLTNNVNVGVNRIENRPPSSKAIVVGASPFTYKNDSANDELINIIGGTISNFLYVHGEYGDSIAIAPQFMRICPGDTIRVTYSVAPTMRKYTT